MRGRVPVTTMLRLMGIFLVGRRTRQVQALGTTTLRSMALFLGEGRTPDQALGKVTLLFMAEGGKFEQGVKGGMVDSMQLALVIEDDGLHI